MPSEHAVLSPSAAERWIACPASIRMTEKVPPSPESPYAAEGTAAHSLGEIEAAYEFGLSDRSTYREALRQWRAGYGETYDEDEMRVHVEAYIELIRQRLSLHPGSQLLLEQRVPTGVPRCWGTSDTVIVSPVHVEVIDLKYGKGIAVEAEGNPQLRLYAVGALDNIADLLGEIEQVRITVFQPRLNHTLTEEISPEDLRQWRDSLIPIAEEALGDEARFGPSDEACRWCPASGRCKAQLEAVFSEPIDDEDFDPEVLSPAELAEALDRSALVRVWLSALDESALDRAYSQGETIPGRKVVMSGGQRKISDAEGALIALRGAGYDDDSVGSYRLNGITALEKLLGKDTFSEVLRDHVTRTSGKPSLVPESDNRPAIDPNGEAAKEFQEEA